jgi:hypothetical protein
VVDARLGRARVAPAGLPLLLSILLPLPEFSLVVRMLWRIR